MKQRKPILLIDQDDVLVEYIKAVTDTFNKQYKTKFKYTDCNRWDLVSIFGERVKEVMHKPELFRHLEPVEDALEVFERLYTSDLFDMYIVTAAHPSAVEAKFLWIREYLPYFPEERVIVCSAKHMVKGDYLLDDGMHNIRAFKEAGGTPIVFDRPHNSEEGRAVKRIFGWKEFEQYIMKVCYGNKEDYEELEEKAI